MTLRRRLLLIVLALLAVVAASVAAVSAVSVDRVLTDRLDTQLAGAVDRSGIAMGHMHAMGMGQDGAGRGSGPGAGPQGRVPAFLLVPGQAEDTLGALVVDGDVVRAAVLDRSGQGQPLDAATAAPLVDVPTDGSPMTVDLGGDLGDYRVAAVATRGGQTVVTGLSLAEVEATVRQLATTIAAVALGGLVLAGLAGALLLRHELRPLDRVAATASTVAGLPLSTGEVVLPHRVPEEVTDPRTEVGQVGTALNRLLDHVAAALTAREASERRVRQFVADASHELRTPLTAIRGYAELAQRVPGPVPEDVRHALSRVESESTRMSGLVEDLLLLARLDSGPALRREEVELSGLLVDAVSDARAAGPDHRWQLQLPPEPVTVPGDRDRLHQVVANLLSNARTHTPAGTVVTAAVAPVDLDGAPGVRITVTDDGPGIPADLLPHVFERFRRGDASRSRAAGSSGLGLAIVAAVVEAHHGRVHASSEPGRTEMVVDLPGPVG